jgi:hypothetical protein
VSRSCSLNTTWSSSRDLTDSRRSTQSPATRLEIEVRSATTRHTITVGHVLRWTEGAAVSPSERLKRDRLKAILRDAGVA